MYISPSLIFLSLSLSLSFVSIYKCICQPKFSFLFVYVSFHISQLSLAREKDSKFFMLHYLSLCISSLSEETKFSIALFCLSFSFYVSITYVRNSCSSSFHYLASLSHFLVNLYLYVSAISGPRERFFCLSLSFYVSIS